jgi:hypothetical protein
MVILIYYFPLMGIGGTWLMVAWDALKFSGEAGEGMEAGSTVGLHIYPLDILAVALFLIGIFKTFSKKKLRLEQKLFLAYGAALLLSFVRGLFDFGLKPAGLELRSYLYWYAIALFVQSLTLNRISIETSLRMMLLLSWSLVSLVVVRWGMVLAGLAGGPLWVGAGGFEFRVLSAETAVILLQAVIVTYYTTINKKNLFTIMGMIGLFVVIFVLQHRTVWVEAVISVIAIMGIEREYIRRNFIVLLSIVIPLVVAVILYIIFNTENIAVQFASESVFETTKENSTFAWRVMGWKYLLSPEYLSGISDYLIGKPLGAGFLRPIGKVVVDVSPHNYYVSIFLRTGLIGLSLYLFLTFRLISKLRLMSANGTAHLANMLVVLLIGQLVFSFSYTPGYEQGLWFGLATSVAAWGVGPDIGHHPIARWRRFLHQVCKQ